MPTSRHPKDRFDDLPDTDRVGAHRAENPRMRGWVVLLWAALATVVLIAVGIFGTLIASGQIRQNQGSASVYGLMGNLDRDPNFRRVSLSQARPGDVVSMRTPGGQHVVLFAGWQNGRPMFIDSNNVNPDGSQKVTYSSMRYPIMAIHQYRG